jgi:hypothetical protein
MIQIILEPISKLIYEVSLTAKERPPQGRRRGEREIFIRIQEFNSLTLALSRRRGESIVTFAHSY